MHQGLQCLVDQDACTSATAQACSPEENGSRKDGGWPPSLTTPRRTSSACNLDAQASDSFSSPPFRRTSSSFMHSSPFCKTPRFKRDSLTSPSTKRRRLATMNPFLALHETRRRLSQDSGNCSMQSDAENLFELSFAERPRQSSLEPTHDDDEGIVFETPSKSLPSLFDAGMFAFAPSNFATLTSIHRIPELTTGPLENMFADFAPQQHRPLILSPERGPAPLRKPRHSLPAVLRDHKQTPVLPPKQVAAIAQPSRSQIQPEVQSAPPCASAPKPFSLLQPNMASTPISRKPNFAQLNLPKLPGSFVTPKKALKPFARRWMRIVYGTTVPQRELTAQAHKLLKSRRVLQPVAP